MKGLDVLIDAIARIDAPDVHCVLLGSGDYVDAVRRRAHERGIAERVRFVSGVPQREVPEILSCFDILAVPSLTMPHWKEQFGRVIIEGMACGVALIGSSSGEIPYVIDDAGLVTPEGDVAALADAITSLYRDRALCARIAARGVERVQAHYTNQRIAQQIYDVWTSAVRSRQR